MNSIQVETHFCVFIKSYLSCGLVKHISCEIIENVVFKTNFHVYKYIRYLCLSQITIPIYISYFHFIFYNSYRRLTVLNTM